MNKPNNARRVSDVDLNLLTVFRAVHDTLHVTEAAAVLKISQPAISHALRRLREMLDDELFVKVGRGMAATPLAEQIAPTVKAVLEAVEVDILDRKPFVLEKLARTFTIATTDYVESLLAPELLGHFAADAPSAQLAIVPATPRAPLEMLEAGAFDLAIAGFFGDLPPSFHRQLLFRDTFASAVRKEHPRARSLTAASTALDAFCNERQLLVAPSGELTGLIDRALAPLGKERKVVAGASGFMVAGWMTAESDAVLTAPSRLLAMLTKYLPLRVFDTPVPLEPIEIVNVWHARVHGDPAHKWLRETTASVFARGRTDRKARTKSP